MSKFQHVFVQNAKCICPNCTKHIFSKLQNGCHLFCCGSVLSVDHRWGDNFWANGETDGGTPLDLATSGGCLSRSATNNTTNSGEKLNFFGPFFFKGLSWSPGNKKHNKQWRKTLALNLSGLFSSPKSHHDQRARSPTHQNCVESRRGVKGESLKWNRGPDNPGKAPQYI